MREFRLGWLKGRRTVNWEEDGQRRRFRLEAVDDAAALAEAVTVMQREEGRAADLTTARLWDLYCAEKVGRPVVTTMGHERKSVIAFFGAIPPEDITTEHCRSYTAERRAAGIKDGTIWTQLGHLKIVLNWGEKKRLIDWSPPIERPAKPAPKDRYLSEAEIQRLLDTEMSPHIRLAIILMLSTAARPEAALELTWDRVDFEGGWVDLRLSAEGPRKGRARVPMNSGLRAALTTAHQARLTGHVIEYNGKPVKSVKTGFYNAVKKSGIEGLTPHVLRHTAGVHMAAAGLLMQRISQYMGHSSTRVTERVYARYAPDHMREEAAVLDFTKPRAVIGRESK
ncbi:MAG: site-specific integrase [Pseudomonadota bacterium]